MATTTTNTPVTDASAAESVAAPKRSHRSSSPTNWLRSFRESHGWSQNDLAVRINENGGTVYDGSVISHWESGSRVPSGDNKHALCVIMGLTWQQLGELIERKDLPSAT